MKYFIFRNNTIENLFGSKDIEYSGYDDISYIPVEAETYIWFYQIPIKFDQELLATEIGSYCEKLRLVETQLAKNKTLIIFSLVNLYPIKLVTEDFSISKAIALYNNDCIALSNKSNNVKIFDFSEFTNRYAIESLVDWKYYFISQIGINPKLAGDFRKWFTRSVEEIELKRKKCLVLDLDNTLWGGILGEEGIDGIKIGGDYPGKAYLFFQEALLELSKRGVILTICSKNNVQDVLEVWEKNPFIVLKQQYISAYRINWQNKADNIKELADELNLGLDSFVFVDDNPTERELVKQLLPMVEVPDFPLQPYDLPIFFASLISRYFRVYTITEEDINKTRQYKANVERANEQRKVIDFTEFLASLDINVDIESINNYNLPRIAQMTQKTNQFNLTTKRYTDSDLHGFIEDGWKIYCIKVRDKFGDNGITGCIMINNTEIDTLLLSCRILGKGIEFAFMNSVLNLLKDGGFEIITSRYIPTAKNIQVAEFYNKLGFKIEFIDENGVKTYSLNLRENTFEIKPYYTITIK